MLTSPLATTAQTSSDINQKQKFIKLQQVISNFNKSALKRAIADRVKKYPQQKSELAQLLKRVKGIKNLSKLKTKLANLDKTALKEAEYIYSLQKQILLSDPAIDFDNFLFIRRKARNLGKYISKYGLPKNWESNSSIAKFGWDNAIYSLSIRKPESEPKMIFKPENNVFISDIDLHFSAKRLLLSMPSQKKIWQIHELSLNNGKIRQITPDVEAAVNNYDSCYLPNDEIIFTSTAPMIGVPCVCGISHVATLFTINNGGSGMRQLCFDQEHNWNPTLLNNGKVLFLRWEYSDVPHATSRILMQMNPDGTAQREYYGSNSYWPNAVYGTRPLPGSASKVVGTVSGHHGAKGGRCGQLMISDRDKGVRDADGVVQQIPGFGKKVEPVIKDRLVQDIWPKFLNPFPISDTSFLVSIQLSEQDDFSLYLVDIFDNILLLKKEVGYGLMEPIPLKKQKRPPVIPSTVDTKRKDASVYITSVYEGGGLKDIPKGKVKALRLFTYTYSYHGTGGMYGVLGIDGPWDIKRVLGTVPVEKDGSAFFKVPANTPISLQPLDENGAALAIMRSWMTAMPGETVSCIGCHELPNAAPAVRRTQALSRPPSEIKPWYGDTRGFRFEQEVQPVLNKYCVSCHDGSKTKIPDFAPGKTPPKYRTSISGAGSSNVTGKFSKSYVNLFPYVRGPGLESDYNLLTPMEFHADSTELVQLLKKGHHNVKLDKEAWDRLYTWIDLNTPYHGSWAPIIGAKRAANAEAQRSKFRKRYANLEEDHEFFPKVTPYNDKPVNPRPLAKSKRKEIKCKNWPLAPEVAKGKQIKPDKIVDMGNGVKLRMVYIPAGELVMGSYDGVADEQPLAKVKIDKPFWMGKYEITNKQIKLLNKDHDSRTESRQGMQFGVLGFKANRPDQPAVRVSWNQAMEFCNKLTKKTGLKFTLPTEAQWEYACRSGNSTPFNMWEKNGDFSKHANLADAKIKDFACDVYTAEENLKVIKNPSQYDAYIPNDDRYNDGGLISIKVGSYQPNTWGLHDMHGNVAEWTRSLYRKYPYDNKDGRNLINTSGRRVVRGGSWRDRPSRSTSSFRLSFEPYHKVFNVGFRVITEE